MTYSSSLAAGRKVALYGRGANAHTFLNRGKTLGPVSNTIILIVLALILGLLYLTQVTKTNAYGYQVEQLRTEQRQLSLEHDDLVVASARLKSVERVQNSDPAKSLVSIAPTATVRQ